LGRENIDEGHFRLVAMFASNTAISSIKLPVLKLFSKRSSMENEQDLIYLRNKN